MLERVCTASTERSDPLSKSCWIQPARLLGTYLVAGALLGTGESHVCPPWAGGSLGAKGTLKMMPVGKEEKDTLRYLETIVLKQ